MLNTTDAQTSADYAPFRVVSASGTLLRVDVGAQAGRARSLRRATVLTPSGAVGATLLRTERLCAWLCGDGNEDGKECHFEAVLRASARVDKAVGVLAGSPDVRNVATMSAGADRRIENPERWLQADPIKSIDQTVRWARFPDGIFLASHEMGRDVYAPPIDLASCTTRPVAPFTILSCPGAQLLYEQSRGIAVSFEDYGKESVEPLLGFRLEGREAVVIRLGLKAAMATALLMRGDDGLWRLIVRELDYAQLC